jgi:predicted Zn-dependent protease
MWSSFAGSEDEVIQAEREYGRECALAFATQFSGKSKQADQEGFRLAAAAGFDAGASLSALKRLGQAAPDTSGFAEYVSSHPSLSERVRRLEESLR